MQYTMYSHAYSVIFQIDINQFNFQKNKISRFEFSNAMCMENMS